MLNETKKKKKDEYDKKTVLLNRGNRDVKTCIRRLPYLGEPKMSGRFGFAFVSESQLFTFFCLALTWLCRRLLQMNLSGTLAPELGQLPHMRRL